MKYSNSTTVSRYYWNGDIRSQVAIAWSPWICPQLPSHQHPPPRAVSPPTPAPQRGRDIGEAKHLHREKFHSQVQKNLGFKQMTALLTQGSALHNQQLKRIEESVWTALLYPEMLVQPEPVLAHQPSTSRELHSRCCFPSLFLFFLINCLQWGIPSTCSLFPSFVSEKNLWFCS